MSGQEGTGGSVRSVSTSYALAKGASLDENENHFIVIYKHAHSLHMCNKW